MSAATPQDGPEDVADFLRRIQRSPDKRDYEEAERSRRLEEEFLEGRKQREARRAERARSLSPEKQSPLGSSRSGRALSNQAGSGKESSSAVASPPSPSTISRNKGSVMDNDNQQPETTANILQPQDPPSPSKQSAVAAVTPSRSGTLSWQQRTNSVRGPRNRPLPSVEARSPTRSSQASPTERSPDRNLSRDQISQQLGSKDPSWFRQTEGRGKGSAALRKSQEHQDHAEPGEKQPLYSLSHDTKPQTSGTTDQMPPRTIRDGMPRESGESKSNAAGSSNRLARGNGYEKSPMPTRASQILEPPSQDRDTSEISGRASPGKVERPSSPTRGMGGFVQSAMMRRSDSINKRWSAQNVGGIRRQDSASGVRNVQDGSQDGPKPSEVSASSPRIDHYQRADNHGAMSRSDFSVDESEPTHKDGGSERPSTQTVSRHASSRSRTGSSIEGTASPHNLAYSPSKRWSPTKSSWIESALAKPDAPKPKSHASQPSWMSELNKNKQQRMSKDTIWPPELKKDDAPSHGADISWKSSGEKMVDETISNDSPVTPSPKPKPASLSRDAPTAPSKTEISTSTPRVTSEKRSNPDEAKRSGGTALSSEKTEKPETPPKKDFRTSLKSRPKSVDEHDKGEPEFLSAFGKLKRAETKNYVAPDEFKDNILRGKAGLNNTGGPDNRPRRDSFKESLINQRNSMKAKASEGKPSHPPSPPVTSKEASEIPEAISKKKALGRNDGNVGLPVAPSTDTLQKPDASNSQGKPTDAISTRSTPKLAPPKAPQPSPLNNKLAGRFNPGLASIIAKGPPSSSSDAKVSRPQLNEGAGPSSVGNEPSTSSGRTLEHMTKSRARGPRRRPPETAGGVRDPNVNSTSQDSSPTILDRATQVPVAESPVISTNFKPKPGSPNASRNVTPLKSYPAANQESRSPVNNEKLSPSLLSKSSSAKPDTPPKSSRLASIAAVGDGHAQSEKSVVEEPRLAPAKSSEGLGISLKDVRDSQTGATSPRMPEESAAKKPIELPTWRDEEATQRNVGQLQDQQKAGAVSEATSKTFAPVHNNGIVGRSSPKESSKARQSILGPRSPRPPPARPSTEASKSPPPSKPLERTPSAQTSDAKRLFADFFTESPKVNSKVDLDTQAILNAEVPTSSKIKTLRKQINQIAGDGKISALPSHQEHVLFSDSMYICTHVFGDAKGARITEIYLWAGQSVPSSVLEDVQVFARKLAKDANGALLVFHQGKETPNFFQALGGIVITRHKPSNGPFLLCGRQHLGHIAFDEVDFAPSSFCTGFPFLVVAPGESDQSEKMFLWKGNGCNAEEVGCARLIGMDLGPSNGIVEIDEGSEPWELLSLFKSTPKSKISLGRSADHWKLKATQNNYMVRLFEIKSGMHPSTQQRPPSSPGPKSANGRSGSPSFWSLVGRRGSQPENAAASDQLSRTFSSPSQQQHVIEILPFCQADISSRGIYVLDAFFEIYVIVGPQARQTTSSADTFATALIFAQDYAILASSSQDRPFVPVGTVVLQGAPRDMRACFRAWDQAAWEEMQKTAGHSGEMGVERGRSLRIVPLGAAVTATKEGQR